MKIAKIKNKYMYNTTENDNGCHYYIVFYDRKKLEYHAVQLTHLYIKDKNRFKQVKNGKILIQKFKEFEVPSGLKKEIYTKNINGTKIDLKNKKFVVSVSKRNLSGKQTCEIKTFLDKRKCGQSNRPTFKKWISCYGY